MAEKCLKAIDVLNRGPVEASSGLTCSHPNPPVNNRESWKKERLNACKVIVDVISKPSFRAGVELPRILSAAVACFLRSYNDTDADVRIEVDDSFNRLINSLIDGQLGRLQVELYKEIKKPNSPSKSLKAALTKFSALCHLIKPAKSRVFVASIIQPLCRAIVRDSDLLQEALTTILPKLFTSFCSFFTLPELNAVLASLFVGLVSESSLKRRVAALGISSLYSKIRKPSNSAHLITSLLLYLMNFNDDKFSESPDSSESASEMYIKMAGPELQPLLVLIADRVKREDCNRSFDSLNSQDEKKDILVLTSSYCLLGSFQCLRNIVLAEGERFCLTLFKDMPKLVDLVFEVGLKHSNHNVMTASLEMLVPIWKLFSKAHFLNCVNEREIKTPPVFRKGKPLGAFENDGMKKILGWVEVLRDLVLDKGGKRNRISVRALSLSALSEIIKHFPQFCVKVATSEDIRYCVVNLKEMVEKCWEADPLLKSNCSILFGNLINTLLITPEFLRFDFGPNNSMCTSVMSQRRNSIGTLSEMLSPYEALFMDQKGAFDVGEIVNLIFVLLSALISGLSDENPTCRKGIAAALGKCLNPIIPIFGECSIVLLEEYLRMSSDSYWLVKLEVLHYITKLNFLSVFYIESRLAGCPSLDSLNCCVSMTNEFASTFTGRSSSSFAGSLQSRIEKIVLEGLGDHDNRIRDASIRGLLSLIGNAFNGNDWPKQNCVDLFGHFSFSKLSFPSFSTSSGSVGTNFGQRCIESNISRYVYLLLERLSNTCTDKYSSFGCYSALKAIGTAYGRPYISKVLGSNDFSPKHVSKSLWYLAQDVVPLAIDHLDGSHLPLNLSLHEEILKAITTFIGGADGQNSSNHWLRIYSHAMKMTNICCHIVNGINPSSNTRDSSSKEKQLEKNLMILAENSQLPNSKSLVSSDIGGLCMDELGNDIGDFSHLPLYMRMYELLKGSYISSQGKLDNTSDRFMNFLKSVLELLSVIVQSINDECAPFVESTLGYLRILARACPEPVVASVHELLISLFGNGSMKHYPLPYLANPLEPRLCEEFSIHLHPVGRKDPRLFYYRFFTLPYENFFAYVDAISDLNAFKNTELKRRLTAPVGTGLKASRKLSNRKRAKSFDSLPSKQKGNLWLHKMSDNIDKPSLQSLIRLFEPLVIRFMNTYCNTSIVGLQSSVLFLLCELITVRINYSLLDNDNMFVAFALKQVENIANGHIVNSEQLLPYIFEFFVFLSKDQPSLRSILGVKNLLELAESCLQSDFCKVQEVLPCLRPLVKLLFSRGDRRDATLSAYIEQCKSYRDVLLRLLLAHIVDFKAVNMLCYILRESCSDLSLWKTLSVHIINQLLAIASERKLKIKTENELKSLFDLFDCFNTVSVLPFYRIWQCSVSMSVVVRESGTREYSNEFTRNIPFLLAALKTACRLSEEFILEDIDSLNFLEMDEVMSSGTFKEDELLSFVMHWIRELSFAVSACTSASELLVKELFQIILFLKFLIKRSKEQGIGRLYSAAQRLNGEVIGSISEKFIHMSLRCPSLLICWCEFLVILEYEDRLIWGKLCKFSNSSKCIVSDFLCKATFLLNCELTYSMLTRKEASVLFSKSPLAEDPLWPVKLVYAVEEEVVFKLMCVLKDDEAVCDLVTSAVVNIEFSLIRPVDPMLIIIVVKVLTLLPPNLPCIRFVVDRLLLARTYVGSRKLIENFVIQTINIIEKGKNLSDREGMIRVLVESLAPKGDKCVEWRFYPKLSKRMKLLTGRKLASHSRTPSHTMGALLSFSKGVSEDFFISHLENLCMYPAKTSTHQISEMLLGLHQMCTETANSERIKESEQDETSEKGLWYIISNPNLDLKILKPCMLQSCSFALLVSNKMTESQDSTYLSRALFNLVTDVLLTRIPDLMYQFETLKDKADNNERLWHDSFHICEALSVLVSKLMSVPFDIARLRTSENVENMHMLLLRTTQLCLDRYDRGVGSFSELSEIMMFNFSVLSHEGTYFFNEAGVDGVPKVDIPQGRERFIDKYSNLCYRTFQTCLRFPMFDSCISGNQLEAENSRESELKLTLLVYYLWSYLAEDSHWACLSHFKKIVKPDFFVGPLRNWIISLARLCLPKIHSNFLVFSQQRISKWSIFTSQKQLMGIPSNSSRTILETEFVEDFQVFRNFMERFLVLGWPTKVQFDETWASLLSVVGSYLPQSDGDNMNQEYNIVGGRLAIRGLTTLLLQTKLFPYPGNPSNEFVFIPRHSTSPMLKTEMGKKLMRMRYVLAQSLFAASKVDFTFYPWRTSHIEFKMSPDYSMRDPLRSYDFNIERGLGDINTEFGQLCISFLRHRCCLEQSSRDSSVSSYLPMVLELFSHRVLSNVKCSSLLMKECVRAIYLLSDVFEDKTSYKWMLINFVELHKSRPIEDVLAGHFLIKGICKAFAVLSEEPLEFVDLSYYALYIGKMLESSLHSDVTLQIAVLQSIIILIEEEIDSIVEVMLGQLLPYLLDNVSSLKILALETNSFALLALLLSRYFESIDSPVIDQSMSAMILKVCDHQTSDQTFHVVLRGLEYLVLSPNISFDVKSAISRVTSEKVPITNCARALSVIALTVTSMFGLRKGSSSATISKESSRENLGATDFTDDSNVPMVLMERVSVLFDRLRKGYEAEANVLAKVLPTLLLHFFSTQHIMTTVMGEFLSTSHAHRHHLASIVYEIFGFMQVQGQQSILNNWALLCIDSFVQVSPLSHARWSLTCIFICCSKNKALRAMYPYILRRMDKTTPIDNEIFVMSGVDFFKTQQLSDEEKSSFVNTFESAVSKNEGVKKRCYELLLDSCQK
eukprot:Nk52_evm6s206 gene=Nk52_evmTU6s206